MAAYWRSSRVWDRPWFESRRLVLARQSANRPVATVRCWLAMPHKPGPRRLRGPLSVASAAPDGRRRRADLHHEQQVSSFEHAVDDIPISRRR